MTSPSPSSSPRARWSSSLLGRLMALLSVALLSCSTTAGDGDCTDGRLSCVGECVQARANLLHCGSCGNVCEVAEDCSGGQCTCVTGQSPCPSGCTDLAEDSGNCGACGVACAAGEVCSAGACAGACAADLTQCGMNCVHLADSVLHCGSCEGSCDAGQVCEAGACHCTQGRADCGGGCTDVSEDPLNCGGCNVVCPQGQVCAASVCQLLNGGTGGTGGLGSGGVAGSGGGGLGSGGLGSGGLGSGGLGSGGFGSGGLGSGGLGSGGLGSGGAGVGGGGGGCQATGFHVSGGLLYDANCNEFIMRGVNYPYAWYSTRDTQADFNAIAATGANVIRIVMATGSRWPKTSAAEVTNLISWAKAAKMIAVLEVHDVTGYAEQADSVPLSDAQAYWTGSDITGVLTGQEAYVLVNIANEPNGNDTTASWVTTHVSAVQAIRSAGLTHTLMVDGPNWGQDHENTMRGGGGAPIVAADSLKNLVFSVHMYQVYETANTVTTFFNTFLDSNDMPLVVGEFAADHGNSGDVDEATIMSLAESLGVGYMGWSWSGNGSGLETLDLTQNFAAGSLTTWGNTLINGANGIAATSDVCSVFE